MRNTPLLGPYSRAMPRNLWCSYAGLLFLMSEVPLCPVHGLRPLRLALSASIRTRFLFFFITLKPRVE